MDSAESICNSLARYKVLDSETIRTLRTSWRGQNKDRGDQADEFKRWLVRTGYVTEFQLDLLARGFGDQLFLDDYKLIDRLAKGRHAGVFQAVHSSGQKVAIKVLPPSKAKNPLVLARFLRESRLAARLDHDNIVRTFHHGKTAEGTHFIVMEYLDGDTLEEVLQRRRRLPPAEAVRLLIQGLEGLQHLDEKSMIHRDIKPANMMLVSPPKPNSEGKGAGVGGTGPAAAETTLRSTLKILDVGLSRALFIDEGEPETGDYVDLTREGTLLGTMNYMAPEQARDAHNADIRADIYGLGCVLYEMLSGQPPFPEKNLVRQIRRHAEEKPRPLTEAAPGTPETLDNIVQKMLAKDPAMRYPTPGQAIKELKSFLGTLGDLGPTAKPERPLKTFMTWLDTKVGDSPGTPIVPIPADLADNAGNFVLGTVLGPPTVPTSSGPAEAVPRATPLLAVALPVTALNPAPTQLVLGAEAGAVASVASPARTEAETKPSSHKSVMSSLWAGCKAVAWKFALAVVGLKGRDWGLIGIGALLVLLLQEMTRLIRWLFP